MAARWRHKGAATRNQHPKAPKWPIGQALGAARLKRTLRMLGSLHLASAVLPAGVNAALGQASFRRAPARRLLKRSY